MDHKTLYRQVREGLHPSSLLRCSFPTTRAAHGEPSISEMVGETEEALIRLLRSAELPGPSLLLTPEVLPPRCKTPDRQTAYTESCCPTLRPADCGAAPTQRLQPRRRPGRSRGSSAGPRLPPAGATPRRLVPRSCARPGLPLWACRGASEPGPAAAAAGGRSAARAVPTRAENHTAGRALGCRSPA